MGIRIKLAIVLAVAVVLPVIIGIVSVRWLGRSYFQSEKGALFQTTANHLSSKLRQGMQSEIAATVDWVTLSKLSQTALLALWLGEGCMVCAVLQVLPPPLLSLCRHMPNEN